MSAPKRSTTIAALLAGIALASASAVWAAIAPAASTAPGINDTCFMCHADNDAKGASGRSVTVDGAKFASSVHGEMKLRCNDCHTDVAADKIPHPDKLKAVNCATCHE